MPEPALSLYAHLILDKGQLAREAARAEQLFGRIRFNDKNFALGRITSDVNKFNQSLEAASARVSAFGATAAVYFTITRGLREMVRETLNIEKRLTNINVILKASSSEIK